MRGSDLVGLSVGDGVAVVTIINPPVNALRGEVFDSLFAALRKAHGNPDVKAIVLTGAGGKFSAGFDFTIFGTPEMEQALSSRGEVVAAMGALLENGAKPTVAAIEGPALGGGCELAMACNARLAAAGAQLGLPEVRLGLLPGLGGTQRLPRLVGMEQALSLLMSGQPISAGDAKAIGLVDEVVPAGGDLLAAARHAAAVLAATVAAGKAGARRRTLQLTTHMQQSGEVFEAAVTALTEAQTKVNRRMAGQQHYLLLLDAVAAGLAQGAAAGLQKEGEGFRAASASRLHRILLHMFKTDRSMRKVSGPAWLLMQAYLFLLFVVMYLYVRCIYISSSFMSGYNKARNKDSKGRAQVAGGSRAGGSGSSSGAARRKGT